MSATNTTTNYGLPIFIETDKPAWLVDFNGAMRTIDATLKTNADAIATKSPILTFNDTNEIDFTKTGDIVTAHLASGVSDKVGRALVTPISAPASDQLVAINNNGVQESLDIGTGLVVENNTLNAIDLNLDIKGSATITGFPSGITLTGGYINYALNADKSVGKIYGNINYSATSAATSSRFDLDTGLTVTATGQDYYIMAAGISFNYANTTYSVINIHVNAAGRVFIDAKAFPGTLTYVYLWPCLYFFKDFGDVPTP